MNNLQVLQKQIERYYDIKDPKISFLRESFDNVVYVIQTQKIKIAVLRISKRDIGKDVLFELSWINALAKKSVPIAPIITTRNGNLFFEVDDAIGVMFKYVSGYHLKITSDKKPNLEKIKEGARALANLHNASESQKITLPRKRNIFTELERALYLEPKIIKKLEDGKVFINLIKENIRWAKKQKYKNVFINNDYRAGNVIFGRDSVVAIVDFDWSCMGPVAKDLGLALVEWSFPDVNKGPFDDVMKSFLSAYNDVATNKFTFNRDLYKWMCFACLSDASTYICDSINESQPRKATSSYMLQKYQYFAKLATQR